MNKLYRRVGGRVIRMELPKPDKTEPVGLDDTYLFVEYPALPLPNREFDANPFNGHGHELPVYGKLKRKVKNAK